MTIAALFAEHLTHAGRAVAPLADALAHSRFSLEVHLLRRYDAQGAHAMTLGEIGGRWAGRRVHLGATLPTAVPGDLWFDPCEVAVMLLTPGVPEEETRSWAASARAQWRPSHGWLALRPVAKWQLAAFLRLGRTRLQPTALAPKAGLLDPARLLAGDEDGPATSASVAEAALYWAWFGKLGAIQDDWQAARRLLDEETYLSMWGTPGREWAGGLAELDAFLPIGADTLDIDPLEEFENDEQTPPRERRFFSRYESPRDVAFRTAVSTREGLRTTPLSKGPVVLVDIVQRHLWR